LEGLHVDVEEDVDLIVEAGDTVASFKSVVCDARGAGTHVQFAGGAGRSTGYAVNNSSRVNRIVHAHPIVIPFYPAHLGSYVAVGTFQTHVRRNTVDTTLRTYLTSIIK